MNQFGITSTMIVLHRLHRACLWMEKIDIINFEWSKNRLYWNGIVCWHFIESSFDSKWHLWKYHKSFAFLFCLRICVTVIESGSSTQHCMTFEALYRCQSPLFYPIRNGSRFSIQNVQQVTGDLFLYYFMTESGRPNKISRRWPDGRLEYVPHSTNIVLIF